MQQKLKKKNEENKFCKIVAMNKVKKGESTNFKLQSGFLVPCQMCPAVA